MEELDLVSSRQKICHKLVAKTAKEFCNEVYEICCSNNEFFKLHNNRKYFLRKYWKDYVGYARNILVKMLTMPDDKISPIIKQEISEALILEGGWKVRPDGSSPVLDK